jgi:hypothetical protein
MRAVHPFGILNYLPLRPWNLVQKLHRNHRLLEVQRLTSFESHLVAEHDEIGRGSRSSLQFRREPSRSVRSPPVGGKNRGRFARHAPLCAQYPKMQTAKVAFDDRSGANSSATRPYGWPQLRHREIGSNEDGASVDFAKFDNTRKTRKAIAEPFDHEKQKKPSTYR